MNNDRTEFRLFSPLQRRVEHIGTTYLFESASQRIDFTRPIGAPAFLEPDSVSWNVFKNPLSLFIGGVAAVILELAEPKVGTAVWRHTGFKEHPLRRLRNTGLAAMATVYAAESQARNLIQRINTMHSRVSGVTAEGLAYRADDPRLLDWVYATASFGFIQAHHVYARQLSSEDCDRYYRESTLAAHLYGAYGAPKSRRQLDDLFAFTAPTLVPSSAMFEFLKIMSSRPLLPAQLHRLQPMLVRAAIDIIPDDLRIRLRLDHTQCLRPWERAFLRRAGGFADRLVLAGMPPVLACQRMGLPDHYLYRSQKA
ncbi:oxygenase MpaB family protein [Noviherbaspirillum pedocola]|uniref:DUF2236 domain-containing protein n=1 Tax=Noviherbaspirillum pedocola TaxID=2801341 RepID=A0A934T284_9BURK|nr:oxygenase MpaB family protein [Noviherbaspirillum pedocola]MBK4737684.1 DUF2236 domain-containing protein [Noviherbaspirillum pedocola]